MVKHLAESLLSDKNYEQNAESVYYHTSLYYPSISYTGLELDLISYLMFTRLFHYNTLTMTGAVVDTSSDINGTI